MTAITDAASSALRDFDVQGVPASGEHDVEKAALRSVFALIDAALGSLGVNGAITVKAVDQATLYANLTPAAGDLAVVYNDPTPANNGIYAKVGSTGAGSWTLTSLALPSTFAADLTNVLGQLETVQDAVTSVAADAAAAVSASGTATTAASAASASEAAATSAKNDALAAANATGPVAIFNTRATADAALSGLADQAVIEVMADESLSGRRTRYRKESGAYAFKVYVDQPVAQVGTDNYRISIASGQMDASVSGALLFSGSASQPNYLGVNNKAPIYGDYAADTGYVSGAANVAAIAGGYDNVANGLASIILSQHSIIYSLSTHCTILGGSRHAIKQNADYAGILFGTQNVIEGMCDRSFIIGGSQNQLLDGASVDLSGFLSGILGGTECTSKGRGALIATSRLSTNTGQYGLILASNGSSVTADYGFAHGDGVAIAGTSSIGIGKTISIGNAIYALAQGISITIADGHNFSSARGTGCVTPHAAAHVHTGRNRGNIAGANQALEFNSSQETTGAVAGLLRVYTGYPTQPTSSVVKGRWEVLGVDTATGDVYSCLLTMTTKRVGAAATPTILRNVRTDEDNEIGVTTHPTISVTSGGIYRVSVTGVAGKTIAWNAVFRGAQVVYA